MIRMGFAAVCGLSLILAGCGADPAVLGITGPGTTMAAPQMPGAVTGGSSATGSTGMVDDTPRTGGTDGGRFWQYNTR